MFLTITKKKGGGTHHMPHMSEGSLCHNVGAITVNVLLQVVVQWTLEVSGTSRKAFTSDLSDWIGRMEEGSFLNRQALCCLKLCIQMTKYWALFGSKLSTSYAFSETMYQFGWYLWSLIPKPYTWIWGADHASTTYLGMTHPIKVAFTHRILCV